MAAPSDSASGPQLVVVGEVMGALGTGGELRVKAHNPDSDMLLEAGELVVVHGGETRTLRVDASRPHGKGLRMRLEGVTGRDAARALYGADLCVPRSSLPTLEDGEYYLIDLVGTHAYLADGSDVGPVVAYFPYPGSDVVHIRSTEGIIELPLLEPYLQDVDVAAGRITVAYLEDLRQDATRPTEQE